MGELRLALLGRPWVTRDDVPIAGWTLQESLALLAYLAVMGRPAFSAIWLNVRPPSSFLLFHS
jgi:DNA-binding SARP family transcriptional activator